MVLCLLLFPPVYSVQPCLIQLPQNNWDQWLQEWTLELSYIDLVPGLLFISYVILDKGVLLCDSVSISAKQENYQHLLIGLVTIVSSLVWKPLKSPLSLKYDLAPLSKALKTSLLWSQPSIPAPIQYFSHTGLTDIPQIHFPVLLIFPSLLKCLGQCRDSLWARDWRRGEGGVRRQRSWCDHPYFRGANWGKRTCPSPPSLRVEKVKSLPWRP